MPCHLKAALGAALLLAASSSANAWEAPVLKSAEPFRLQVVASGSPRHITVRGTGFEHLAHPNRDFYMHWQIRRDDGGWHRCTQKSLSEGPGICHGTSWSSTEETLEIGGPYVQREGFIELRVFHALDDEDAVAPASPEDWSNIIRVPVVVPGPAPKIVSLSQEKFPTNGKPDEYTFLVEASGLTGTPAIVFRGDVVVYPERIYGGTKIQVSVPEVYRLRTPGEIPLAVRTDKGGSSKEKYIRFVAPIELQVSTGGKKLKSTVGVAPGVKPPTDVVEKSAGQAIAPAAGPAPSGPCIQSFVWREATPNDHVCVAPEMRSLIAQQNRDRLAHGVMNQGKMYYLPSFVWREAVAGDQVCVTPQERSKVREDNRLASSRVAE
jgi:hypothetical protein